MQTVPEKTFSFETYWTLGGLKEYNQSVYNIFAPQPLSNRMKTHTICRTISFIVIFTIASTCVFSQERRDRGNREPSSDRSRMTYGGPPGGGGQFGGMRPGGGGPFGGGGFPGGGGPFGGGGFPGAGGPGGAGPGGGNDAERNQRIVGMLKNMDANNDGRLDQREIPESRRPFVQMMAQRLGVNPNQPINLRALEKSTASSQSNASRSAIVLPENPLVPYFGEITATITTATTAVLAFGQRENAFLQTAVSDSRDQRRNRGQQPQNSDVQLQQTTKAARDLLTRNDKNRNGTLDKLNDEWNGLPFDTNTADKNKDGRLTLTEMIVALGGKPSANLGAAKVSSMSASFRDRMPEVVPEWFTRMDADNDGQVTMLEYAEKKPFNDGMIAEFKANDANNDGIITITECYAFLKRMDDQKRKEEEQTKIDAARTGNAPPPNNGRDPRRRDDRERSGEQRTVRPSGEAPTPPTAVPAQQSSPDGPRQRPQLGNSGAAVSGSPSNQGGENTGRNYQQRGTRRNRELRN